MQPVHVTPEGAILAFCFLASVVGVITWMLHVPAKTPTTLRVARAIRLAERANRHTREAGPAIVEEAVAAVADIILMGDLPERPGQTRFSATTSYVFAHALCEVIVDHPALGVPSDGSLRFEVARAAVSAR